MTKSLIPKAVIGLGAMWAVWLNVVTPIGRPCGQPALVNHARYAVDGPTGFDQAQR